jgi:hypothetical protein
VAAEPFNRSGDISFCSIFVSSCRVARWHLKLLVIGDLPHILMATMPLFKRWILLFVTVDVFCPLCATSCTFSMVASERWHSRIRRLRQAPLRLVLL